MKYLTSCGDTSELTAARSHGIVAVFYAVALAGLTGALVMEAIMLGWHRASVTVHRERARAKGEA